MSEQFECECGSNLFKRYLLDEVELSVTKEGIIDAINTTLTESQMFWCAVCGKNQQGVLKHE